MKRLFIINLKIFIIISKLSISSVVAFPGVKHVPVS